MISIFMFLFFLICLEQVDERLYGEERHDRDKYIFVHDIDPAAPLNFAGTVVFRTDLRCAVLPSDDDRDR